MVQCLVTLFGNIHVQILSGYAQTIIPNLSPICHAGHTLFRNLQTCGISLTVLTKERINVSNLLPFIHSLRFTESIEYNISENEDICNKALDVCYNDDSINKTISLHTTPRQHLTHNSLHPTQNIVLQKRNFGNVCPSL